MPSAPEPTESKPKSPRAVLRELERAQRALHPGASKRRALRRAIVDSAERFLDDIETLPSFRVTDDQGSGLLDSPIGADGISIERAVALLEHNVVRPGANTASGGHLAYIPGSSVYHASLGDYFAAVTNKYAGIFFSAPGAVRMENMLLRWTADLVGYPAEAGGNVASGGSIANLTAITAARDAAGLKGADYSRAVVYLTSQAHHCIDKALRIAGMAETRLHYVAMDDRFRMRPDALQEAIDADRRLGFNPWMVIASAGTTDTGAVDPLEAIGTIARGARCWYHVDAAYGGFFLLTEYGRTMLRGIEGSDSVVLDPHKSLFLPYGTGIVLVRDRATLLVSNHYQANYMQDAVRDASEVSPADVSPELTKHFRALRMWLPLVVVGTAPFTAALDEKLLLARYFRRKVARLGFEVGPEPDLSIVTYRWAPDGVPLEEANAMNRAILEGSQQDGRVFLSSTMIGDRYTLRLVALSSRTHRRTIDLALAVLAEQVAKLRTL
ncbi:MAG: aminotransferase class V-fold PLP-dependent enzyme [Gemmatimonadota bacterium]